MRAFVESIVILIFISTLFLIITTSIVFDTINTTKSIKDGEVIVSADRSFQMGLFSPDRSINCYLGFWYNKIYIVIVDWVANKCFKDYQRGNSCPFEWQWEHLLVFQPIKIYKKSTCLGFGFGKCWLARLIELLTTFFYFQYLFVASLLEIN